MPEQPQERPYLKRLEPDDELHYPNPLNPDGDWITIKARDVWPLEAAEPPARRAWRLASLAAAGVAVGAVLGWLILGFLG